MSSDLSTRAAAADWSIPVAACMTSDTPIKPMAPARPMLVTREKMMMSGDAPFRSPSRRHPAGGDPVLGDGEFFEQRVDATLAALGPHYEFKRTYRSRVTFKGPLGASWDHSYDKRILGVHGSSNGREWLEPACDKSFDFQDGELNIVHFTRDDASSLYHPLWRAKGMGLTLDLVATTNGDVAYQIHDANGGTLIFDTSGYLAKMVDVVGNALTFDWDLSGEYMPDAVVYGPAKHLVRVHDGKRIVNYIYDAQKALQCVSLGTSCGDATSRPADVLAYFVYNTNHELQTVYHGQGTTGERMVYRSEGPLILLSYYPADCMPNADLAPFCNRLCGTVDANNPASCVNVDASGSYLQYCSSVTCQLAPGASSATTPDQILCKRRLANPDGDVDPLCMSAYNMSPGCLQGCLQYRQCLMSWGVPTNAFWSFGSDDDLVHNITDIYDERGKLEVHNEYGETPWDVSFDRVVVQKTGGASDENTTVKFAYHDLVIEQAGGVSILPPPGASIWAGPYSKPDPMNVVPRPQYGEGSVCPRASGCTNAPDGTCSLASYDGAVPFVVYPTEAPIPASATVITDVHGITRTQYFDSDMNLIREVNDLAHRPPITTTTSTDTSSAYRARPVFASASSVTAAAARRRRRRSQPRVMAATRRRWRPPTATMPPGRSPTFGKTSSASSARRIFREMRMSASRTRMRTSRSASRRCARRTATMTTRRQLAFARRRQRRRCRTAASISTCTSISRWVGRRTSRSMSMAPRQRSRRWSTTGADVSSRTASPAASRRATSTIPATGCRWPAIATTIRRNGSIARNV